MNTNKNRVGLDERGLLITLLNLPPGWEFSISGLCRLTRDGPAAVRSCPDRLVRHGCVWIVPAEIKKTLSRHRNFMSAEFQKNRIQAIRIRNIRLRKSRKRNTYTIDSLRESIYQTYFGKRFCFRGESIRDTLEDKNECKYNR